MNKNLEKRFAYVGYEWSNEEKQWILDHYTQMSVPQLAQEFQRTSDEIRAIMRSMNIKFVLEDSPSYVSPHTYHDVELPDSYQWTPEEEEYLKQNYSKQPMSQIKKHINRSKRAIVQKAWKLGVKSIIRVNRPWTNQEIAFLKENYGKHTNEDLSETLGRSYDSIRRMAVDLALSNIRNRNWEEWEDKIIEDTIKEHPYISTKELRKKLPNRSVSAISIRRSKLGLHKNIITYKPTPAKRNSRNYRQIMSAHIGRKLTSEEHIHHINFMQGDNRIENLVIVNKKEHMSCHLSLYTIVEELMRKNIIGFDINTKKYFTK